MEYEDSTLILVHRLAAKKHLHDHIESYMDLTRNILRKGMMDKSALTGMKLIEVRLVCSRLPQSTPEFPNRVAAI